MNKTILAAVAATTMLSGVANATLVSNGGQPSISLSEIQANLDSGKYTNYPGVVREVNGIRIGPSGGGYLFAKTFTPGMALPVINDVVALQKALAKKDETILVASNDWILPIPAVFVELAKQNGVEPAMFLGHYLEATAGIEADSFVEYAKAQTAAVIDVLGISAVTVNTEILVNTGLTIEQAEAIADAAAKVATDRAQVVIDGLTTENMQLVADLMTANSLKAEIQSMLNTANGKLTAIDAAIPSFISGDTILERVEELAKNRTHFNNFYSSVDAIFADREFTSTDLINHISGLESFIQRAGVAYTSLSNQVSDAKRAALQFSTQGQGRIYSNTITATSDLAGDFAAFSQEVSRLRTLVQTERANAFDLAAAKRDALANFDAEADTPGAPNITSIPTPSYNGTDAANTLVGTVGSRIETITGEDVIEAEFSEIDRAALVAAISSEIETALAGAYDNGYSDGFEAGYEVGYGEGFTAGVNSVN